MQKKIVKIPMRKIENNTRPSTVSTIIKSFIEEKEKLMAELINSYSVLATDMIG